MFKTIYSETLSQKKKKKKKKTRWIVNGLIVIDNCWVGTRKSWRILPQLLCYKKQGRLFASLKPSMENWFRWALRRKEERLGHLPKPQLFQVFWKWKGWNSISTQLTQSRTKSDPNDWGPHMSRERFEMQRHVEKKAMWGQRQRLHGYSAISQGRPGSPEAGRDWEGPPLKPSQRAQPCQHLDFRLGLQNQKITNVLFSATQFVVIYYNSPINTGITN
jgi:hypothetical protein